MKIVLVVWKASLYSLQKTVENYTQQMLRDAPTDDCNPIMYCNVTGNSGFAITACFSCQIHNNGPLFHYGKHIISN